MRRRGTRTARRYAGVGLVVMLGACESMTGGGDTANAPVVDTVVEAAAPVPRVVDLTQPLEPGIPYFPGGAPFTVTELARIEDGYYSRAFTMGEHTGTHVDAPGHFVAGRPLLDALDAHDLIAPLVVIDVRERVAANPDYALDRETLDAWEREHGPVPDGAVVALLTGWDARWTDPERYRNADEGGTLHFPGFGVEASTFLVETRGVRAVAVDTLSTDPGIGTSFAQHKSFLAHGAYQIENLRNLDALPPTGATIVVGVLPIRAGSGAPARVIAIIPAPPG